MLAPAMVIDSGTWDDEIEKWAPGMDVTQVPYSSMCVRRPRGRVIRDGNGFPKVDLKPELRRRWKTVIADEAHYMKGRKTSWSVAAQMLDTEDLKLATGTPIPNWAHEAFMLLRLIYPEKTRSGGELGSYWRWARYWFQVGPTPFSMMDVGDLLPERTWEEFIAGNWGDRMLLRLREDCLDLPPLTITPFHTPMGKEQRRVYNALKRDFIAWLDSGAEIVAWNSAAQLIKLMKCATGLEVLEPGARGSSKLDALRALLRDRPRQTLVVGHFRDSVAACARASASVRRPAMIVDGGTSRAKRREIIRSFQSGNLDVLCATVDTISEGMTLHQGGADQVVRVERSAKPSRNDQVVRRLHRIGQERPVQVIDLIAPGTVDERILYMLDVKTDQQMKALGRTDLRDLAR